MATTVIVGIDTGGTFTDLVAIVGGRLACTRCSRRRTTPRARLSTDLKRCFKTRRAARIGTARRSGHLQLDRRDQRAARTQGRARRAGDQRRLRGPDRDRPPEPHRSLCAGPQRPEPLVPRAMRFGVGRADLLRRHDRAPPDCRRTDARAQSWPPRATPKRSPSACSIRTPTRQANSDRARADAAWRAALGFASDPRRIPRVRAALDHRDQRLRGAADGPRISAIWSAACGRRACA